MSDLKFTHEQLAEKIFQSLKGSNFTWRTINGIAGDTGINNHDIKYFLENSSDIIRSSTANTSGQFLYSTRERYKQETPLLDRAFTIIKSSTD